MKGYSISGFLIIDGHVHYYDCFGWDVLLDGAAAHFEGHAEAIGAAPDISGLLLLAETSADHHFRGLRRLVGRLGPGPWSFNATDEDCSLIAERHDGQRIILVAGRQIITREGLEVLALCCDREFADGRPIRVVIDEALAADALVVLPWGFGKWWFRRGMVVSELLRSELGRWLFVGDNGGRPRPAPRPWIFELARSRGVRILPGSDPFPFRSQSGFAGRYGFVLEGRVSLNRPAEGVKRLLRRCRDQPPIVGRRTTIPGFCRSQMVMHMRKFLRRRVREVPE